jgi:hypothetical protein
VSNHLAVATVTAALARVLQAAAAQAVPAADVKTGRPVAPAGVPPTRVYLYLYEVTPNVACRNGDLPTRNGNGDVVQRPRVALDLHYLVSFSGNEDDLEPQRMLGSVSRALHAQPLITRQLIEDTMADPAVSAFLANSNLADQIDRVKVTPLTLSLEEMSKLWSVFFQVPHLLSVAYRASVILIESEVTPRAALPVAERLLYVVPFRYPSVEEVEAAAGAALPIFAGDRVILRGHELAGPGIRVRLSGHEAVPVAVSNTAVDVDLTSPPFAAGVLRAGVQGIQLVYPIEMGNPPLPHRGVESNVAALALRPRIVAPVGVANVVGGGANPRSADLTLQLDPIVGARQRVVLLLDQRSLTPAAYSFEIPPRGADANVLTTPVAGIVAGEYFVRLRVDGADSVLNFDMASPDFGPRVVIP